jgi:hypothetical protein
MATPDWTSTQCVTGGAWHVHITLSMAARAWLVVARELKTGEPEPRDGMLIS